MSTSARDEVLGRVRTALGPGPRPSETVPREYRTSSDLGLPQRLDLFAQRVSDYRATVTRVSPDRTADAVTEVLAARSCHRVGLPPGVPVAWVGGVEAVVDHGQLSVDDLDSVDGVVTTCAVAIAETGTLVLDGSPGSGRRALTLVPDLHVCVVRADQVVASVPEALHRLDPARPLTFISGPSATSDIELDRVEGVHGPRTLHVVLVGPPAPPAAGVDHRERRHDRS